MQSATYNNAVLQVEAQFFFLNCSYLRSAMQYGWNKNAAPLLNQSTPTTPSHTTLHPHKRCITTKIKRRKERTPSREEKKYICVNQTAVHYVDLSSSFLIEKKCTGLDNWPKTQSSHFLTVASIHWSNHEKRGDDVPDFQRTNKSLLIEEPIGSCHVNLK